MSDGQGSAALGFIKCPKCGSRSYHPDDISNRYCGRCHDWHRWLVQVTAPHFCAGLVFDEQGRAAPILRRRWLGKTFSEVRADCVRFLWEFKQIRFIETRKL